MLQNTIMKYLVIAKTEVKAVTIDATFQRNFFLQRIKNRSIWTILILVMEMTGRRIVVSHHGKQTLAELWIESSNTIKENWENRKNEWNQLLIQCNKSMYGIYTNIQHYQRVLPGITNYNYQLIITTNFNYLSCICMLYNIILPL